MRREGTTQQMGAGGSCGQHGLYNGHRCPRCAKVKALADLRQATWEAMQWLSREESREYFEDVLREIESDEP